jgi:hypothetical protein
MVGLIDGESDVAACEGLSAGGNDGALFGKCVGLVVGEVDGVVDGKDDGAEVGARVVPPVGSSEGEVEGGSVGAIPVGSALGSLVGSSVGAEDVEEFDDVKSSSLSTLRTVEKLALWRSRDRNVRSPPVAWSNPAMTRSVTSFLDSCDPAGTTYTVCATLTSRMKNPRPKISTATLSVARLVSRILHW